jgi:hypothetical protein
MIPPDDPRTGDAMNFEVDYRRDDRVFFTSAIMSSEWNGQPISVTQHVNGSMLFLTVGQQRFSLSVEQLAIAWLESVLEGPELKP